MQEIDGGRIVGSEPGGGESAKDKRGEEQDADGGQGLAADLVGQKCERGRERRCRCTGMRAGKKRHWHEKNTATLARGRGLLRYAACN